MFLLCFLFRPFMPIKTVPSRFAKDNTVLLIKVFFIHQNWYCWSKISLVWTWQINHLRFHRTSKFRICSHIQLKLYMPYAVEVWALFRRRCWSQRARAIRKAPVTLSQRPFPGINRTSWSSYMSRATSRRTERRDAHPMKDRTLKRCGARMPELRRDVCCVLTQNPVSMSVNNGYRRDGCISRHISSNHVII